MTLEKMTLLDERHLWFPGGSLGTSVLAIWFCLLVAFTGCHDDPVASPPPSASSGGNPADPIGNGTAQTNSENPTNEKPRSLVESGPNSTGSRRHALLIGCSEYTNLDEWVQLRGPANDVGLMRQLLIDRFEFDPEQDDIVTLAANEDADHQPTRANIEREFLRLAETVQAGEPVVILMGGHGSQQPDNDPDNPDDAEPDGRDEIFLPSDVKKWNGSLGSVENAIVDDEFRGWLSAMVGRGAFIWLIMDACHSGSGVRGSDSEVSRQVPPDKLVPEAAFEKVKSSTDHDSADAGRESSLFNPSGEGGIVAIYAAQPFETTPERKLPLEADADAKKYYGLLTFTICEILTNANRNLTYTELVQAIQTRYITMGRRSPTPLLEGTHRDNLILGRESFPQRSQIVLERADAKTWKLNTGALQGLTKGSVLAVYPPTGSNSSDDTEPVGHVRVTKSELTSAVVEEVAFNDLPLNRNLPNRGRCEIVYQDFGHQALRVMVDRVDNAGDSVPDALYEKIVAELNSEPSTLVQFVDDPEDADWLVRWDSGEIVLLPATGVSRSDVAGQQESLPPLPFTDGWSKTAQQNLERVSRARNLLRLTAGASETTLGSELGFEMQVLDRDAETPLEWETTGLTLEDGQRVRVLLQNNGNHSLDITLLYVDSAYGITCLYPNLGEFNRLGPGDQQKIDLSINATTTGIENMVAIVVRGRGQPVDFSILEQPSISAGKTRGFGDDALSTPLGELYRSAMYGEGNTRGVKRNRTQDYGVHVLSWRIKP